MAREWATRGLTVRVVRGQKMRTDEALFNEVAAAFQFPSYFGENWDALDECIVDLEWLAPGSGYVLYVVRADEVLADEREWSIGVFVRVLNKAIMEWGTEVAQGEWWDRPPVAFNVVLQVDPQSADAGRSRWIAAGAAVDPLGWEPDVRLGVSPRGGRRSPRTSDRG